MGEYGRREEGEAVRRAVLRVGISAALADYQPLRITRCAQTDVQRLKRRRRNPPLLAQARCTASPSSRLDIPVVRRWSQRGDFGCVR